MKNWLELMQKRISIIKILQVHIKHSTRYFMLKFLCKLINTPGN